MPQAPSGLLARQSFIGFAADAATAALLESSFEGTLTNGGTFHVVDFRKTLAILSRIPCPQTLLVDLTGEEQPLSAMLELAELVEPGTNVLVIGPARELSFYRAVVNGMGVREYLAKPLTKPDVIKLLLPHIQPDPKPTVAPLTGHIIALTGARGGVGTTTIAANLAWIIGHDLHRHTILLDTDLQTGTAALALNVDPSWGLAAALQSPERMDSMLIERVAQPAGDRLHVLAGQESLTQRLDYPEGAAKTLTKALLGRFKFVIADTGARRLPFARDILELAQQRVIILDPSIMSLRNFERLTAQPANPGTRTTLVLNQAGRPYGLTQKFMEQSLSLKFDIVIPDLPRIIPKAEKFGEMGTSIKGPFRDAITKLAHQLGAAEPAERAFPKVAVNA
ncbi:MAG: cellulose synthase operon protein YhjQ/BcsQ [Acidocella sp.]|nr:cellulose synthase operon protein YhjQ/BcsQ [Acidocella sp.]